MKEYKKNLTLTQSTFFNYKNGSIIRRNGEEIYMEYRLKELFFIFLNNKNEIITRDELRSLMWKDIIVNDESISKAVSDLRKFFSKNGLENFNIITVPKIGYRLEFHDNSTSTKKKLDYPRLFLKVITIAILIFLVLIILIRAARY